MNFSEQYILAHLQDKFEKSNLEATVWYEFDEEELLHKVRIEPREVYNTMEVLDIYDELFDALYDKDPNQGIVFFNGHEEFDMDSPVCLYDRQFSVFENFNSFFKLIDRTSVRSSLVKSQELYNKVVPEGMQRLLSAFERIEKLNCQLANVIQEEESEFELFPKFENRNEFSVTINENSIFHSVVDAGEYNYENAA